MIPIITASTPAILHFVSSSIYRKAIRLAQSEGIDLRQIEHHQHEKAVREGSRYLPIELLYEVYELADAETPPGFSVRQGIQLEADDYGTLGLSWKTCWRAKDLLDRIDRYMILVTDHGEVRIKEEDQNVEIHLLRTASRRGIEMANEVTFVMITNILTEVTGKRIRPTRVSFEHGVRSTDVFSDFFCSTVRSRAPQNIIAFAQDDMATPTLKADRSLHQFLLDRMEEEVQGISVNANKLLADVNTLVTEALPGGKPNLKQIGEHLGMSNRTLKRRLADHGIAFRDLVQGIQLELSIQLLRTTEQSVGEIAFQTGFSEQSAFNRAFKRWTGTSPTDYRKSD